MTRVAGSGAVIADVGLGSNVGDRLGELRAGIAALDVHPDVEVLAFSSVYESEYVGPGRQAPYLNACVRVSTTLRPRLFLEALKRMEAERGRPVDSHMEPRTLDLDILLFGDRRISEPDLEVPHPRLRERAFVLEPLAELAGGEVLPDSGQTVREACDMMRSAAGPWVRPWPHGGLRRNEDANG